jgi:hypothetical protein
MLAEDITIVPRGHVSLAAGGWTAALFGVLVKAEGRVRGQREEEANAER